MWPQTDPKAARRQSLRSNALTLFWLSGLALLGGATGYWLLGGGGLLIGVLLLAFTSFIGLRVPGRLVMRMQGSFPIRPHSAPALHQMVERLAARAGIQTPGLYLLPRAEPNAMATGDRDEDGALAVTEGLLAMMSRDELEGVLAHEVAHLRHRDTTLMRLAAVAGQAVVSLLQIAAWVAFFALVFLGTGFGHLLGAGTLALAAPPLVRTLLAALSRTREFAADTAAAELTGKPLALASALVKLSRQRSRWLGWLLGPVVEPPLLRSHPATRQRVERLRALARREPVTLPRSARVAESPARRQTSVEPTRIPVIFVPPVRHVRLPAAALPTSMARERFVRRRRSQPTAFDIMPRPF